MTSQPVDQLDFFISYTAPDEQWATWIAWTLEAAGYTTELQAWDFGAGTNFVLEMQRAAEKAKRTISVLTPAYFESSFGAPEWAVAFGSDPEGLRQRLVPVLVEPVNAPGLWGQIVHIDLIGLDGADAAKKLLAEIAPGRTKPLTAPSFPGPSTTTSTAPVPQSAPASVGLRWRPVNSPLPVTWRSDLVNDRSGSGPAILELHIVPAAALRIEMRRLRNLAVELIAGGRARGVFTATQAVDPFGTENFAGAVTQRSRNSDETGLAVTRSGQRSAWVTLPNDGLGSVLDPDEAQSRIAALVDVLCDFDVEQPDEVGLAIKVDPIMMLTVGSENVLGSRSSSSMAFAMQSTSAVEPDDVVSFEALKASSASVAEELMARLLTRLQNR